MSATAQVNVPSFAPQVSSMIDFVRFCQQERVLTTDAIRQSWLNVEKNVIIPNGLAVDSLLIPDIPDNTRAIDSYVSKVCTLARGIFDPRVEQYNRTKLTPTIVLSQGLHRKKLFEEAVKMELLTAKPVDAMVASALKVKPLVTDASAWVTLASFWFAFSLGGLVSTIFGITQNDVSYTLVSGAATLLSAAGTVLFLKKFSNLHEMYFPPKK